MDLTDTQTSATFPYRFMLTTDGKKVAVYTEGRTSVRLYAPSDLQRMKDDPTYGPHRCSLYRVAYEYYLSRQKGA